MIQQEFAEMGEDFREFCEEFRAAWEAGVLPGGLMIIALYVITWVFLAKTGLVANSLTKAKKKGRVVTAHYDDTLPEEVRLGTDVKPGEIRCINYRYTHPVTGVEKKYELNLSKHGVEAPMELPLYYTALGKMFSGFEEDKANKSSPFWMAIGIIVPGVVASVLLIALGWMPE